MSLNKATLTEVLNGITVGLKTAKKFSLSIKIDKF